MRSFTPRPSAAAATRLKAEVSDTLGILQGSAEHIGHMPRGKRTKGSCTNVQLKSPLSSRRLH
jgi:hypothetical protein